MSLGGTHCSQPEYPSLSPSLPLPLSLCPDLMSLTSSTSQIFERQAANDLDFTHLNVKWPWLGRKKEGGAGLEWMEM